MKKKFLLLTIAVCTFALLLTSCTKKQTAEDVVAILQSDTYHFTTFRLFEDGEVAQIHGREEQVEHFFREGVFVNSNSYSRNIYKKNSQFEVWDNLEICEISEFDNSEMINYSAFKFSETGKDEFDAENLTYQEYRNEEQSITIRFFEKDNNVIGMRIFRGGHIIDERLLLIDQIVPDSVFEIPDDYEIQDNRTPPGEAIAG